MSKKKIVSWLLSLCLLGGLVAMPGVAGASGVETPVESPPAGVTVEWTHLVDQIEGEDANDWSVLVAAPETGWYVTTLYDENGVAIASANRAVYILGSGPEPWIDVWNVAPYITESGTYTVGAVKDGATGAAEVKSDPRTYTKPTAFPTPTGLAWDVDEDGIAMARWDWVEGDGTGDYYRVRLVQKGSEDELGYSPGGLPFNPAAGTNPVRFPFAELLYAWMGSGVADGEALPGDQFLFVVWLESEKIATTAHSDVAIVSQAIEIVSMGDDFGSITVKLVDSVTTPPEEPDPVAPAAPVGVAWEAGEDVWTIGFTPKANVQHTLKLYDNANPTTALQTKTVSGTIDTKVTWDVAAFIQLPANDGKSFLVGVTAIGTPNSAEVKSAPKTYTDPVAQVVEDIGKIVVDPSNPDTALTALESAGDVDELYEAMQKDADVAAKIDAIEAAYIAKNADTNPKYDVAASLADIVGTNADVSAVGLALNAIDTTASVTLSIDPVAEGDEETVGLTGYENVLQLAISLTGNVQTTLTVPVRITMPIPEGVSEQNLVILHYTTPGSAPEVIVPDSIVGGKVTFTVTSFSTFAFANKVRQSGPSYDHDWSQDLPTVAPPPQEWQPGSPSLTAPVPSFPATNFYRVLARSLNQRGGPGTNYPIMGKLTQNALIQIVGFSEDGQWAQTSAGTWLSMAYLSGTNAASGTGNYVVNVSSSLNVRSGPGTGSATIGKLYAGASVRALSVENGWALIEYNGGTAYVSAMYLK